MATAHVHLVEFASGQHQARPIVVDESAHVAKNIKLLGEDSKNNRIYPLTTRQKAAALYEGAHVNIDHPAKPTDPRPYSSRFGVVRNVVVEHDGTFGDIHYNPEHSEAKSFVWFCKNQPGTVGMSHNAIGREVAPASRGGKAVVEEIESVVSVDIVTNPATTRGLSEGVIPMAKTFKEHLVAILKGDAKRLALVEEIPPAMAAAEAPKPDAGGGDGGDPLDGAFANALHAAVDAYAKGDLDNAAFMAKIKEISKYWEKMSGSVETPAPTPGDGGAGSPTPESVTTPRDDIATLREEIAIRDLVEDAGLTFTKAAGRKVFIRSLVPLSESERTEMIEERKAQQVAAGKYPPPKPPGARSAAPKNMTEQAAAGGNGSKPQTRDDVISSFRR